MRRLGLDVPRAATDWVDDQIERLWHLRGPAPGLAAVLGHLGVDRHMSSFAGLMAERRWSTAPWGLVERALDPADPLGAELAAAVPPSIGHSWRGLHPRKEQPSRCSQRWMSTAIRCGGS